jgi:hypothetical protein
MNQSSSPFADEGTEHHVAHVLGDHVVVVDLSDHLDIVFLLPF